MVTTRRRSILTLGIVAVLMTALLGQSRGFLAETEAFWTDPEHTVAEVKSGAWPTSGYGRGISSYVKSAGGLTLLGGTALPWPGMQASRNQTPAGTSTASVTGPTSSANVVGVNRLTQAGPTGTGPATGSACGSYSVGSLDAPCVAGSTASASASITGETLRMSAVAVLGIDLISTDIVRVDTAARAISASVSCNVAANSSTAVAPTSQAGYVLVGNKQVAIPAANGTTSPPDFSEGLTISYTGVKLRSSVASGPTTANAHSRLRLSGTATATTVLGLRLLSINFDFYLVSAECGPGAAPAFPPANDPALANAAARQAVPEAAVQDASTSAPPATTTAESASTTESETTTQTTTPTTTEEAAARPVPVETTTEPPTVEAAEPPPVETAEPPPTPTTTTPPPTTTEPPDPATVFTGPAEGNVETLTFAGDVVCTAPTGADYTGTVELACDDGSSVAAIGSALTPAGVAASTAGGVWSPVLTAGGTARPVLAATRG